MLVDRYSRAKRTLSIYETDSYQRVTTASLQETPDSEEQAPDELST